MLAPAIDHLMAFGLAILAVDLYKAASEPVAAVAFAVLGMAQLFLIVRQMAPTKALERHLGAASHSDGVRPQYIHMPVAGSIWC
jgi:hypothetical protein